MNDLIWLKIELMGLSELVFRVFKVFNVEHPNFVIKGSGKTCYNLIFVLKIAMERYLN